jgi:hypothetical protein
MAQRRRKAWLITWEDFGNTRLGLGNKRRVVAVLPPLFDKRRVKQIVVALYCAQGDLTLSGRIDVGLSRERRFLYEEDEQFFLGYKPFLRARKVINLRVTEKDGLHTLSWTELPFYRPENESSMRDKLIRPEREASFSEHEDEAFGRGQGPAIRRTAGTR